LNRVHKSLLSIDDDTLSSFDLIVVLDKSKQMSMKDENSIENNVANHAIQMKKENNIDDDDEIVEDTEWHRWKQEIRFIQVRICDL
jgi:hypothetical protein